MTTADEILIAMRKEREKKDDIQNIKTNELKINNMKTNNIKTNDAKINNIKINSTKVNNTKVINKSCDEYRLITNEDICKISKNDTEYEFLMNEVLRFINENNRLPTNKDMNCKFGYPNNARFYVYFAGWGNYKKGVNGAVEFLYGYCNSNKLKMPFVESIKKVSAKERYDFFTKIESNLINVLECKTDGKLYHKYRNIINKDYGKIVFKFSSLNNNIWIFNLRTKIEDNQDINNFVCIGADYKITKIEYIWIIPNKELNNIKNLTVYNTIGSLNRLKKYDISNLFNHDRLTM